MSWLTKICSFDDLEAVRLLMEHAQMDQQEAMSHLPALHKIEQMKMSRGQPFDLLEFAKRMGGLSHLDQAQNLPGIDRDLNPHPPTLKYHPPVE